MAAAGILEFLEENGAEILKGLIGLDDIEACFTEGDIEACIWTLIGFVPWGKIGGVIKAIVKIIPKVGDFLKGITKAKKSLDESDDVLGKVKACLTKPRPGSGGAGFAAAATADEDPCSFEAPDDWKDKIDDDGVDHAGSRHTKDGGEYRPGKDSVWDEGVDFAKLAKATEGKKGRIQKERPPHMPIEFILEADRVIGKLPDGSSTRTYTVIRDRFTGDLITTHPGRPTRPEN